MEIPEALMVAMGQQRKTDIDAERAIRLMTAAIGLYRAKTFNPGDTVTFIEGMDERPDYARHVPMVVVRMRDPGRLEDQDPDWRPNVGAQDVLVMAMKGDDVFDIGWASSRVLREWTPKIGAAIRLRYAPIGEAQGHS